MKTLLTFPPFRGNESGYPPLGLGYIASVLNREKIEVEGLDLSVVETSQWKKGLTKKLESFEPEIVGISAMTYVYNSALKIAKYIKDNNPKTYTVLGGSHPTIFPEAVLKNKFIDFVVRGEGEFTTLGLVNSLKNNESLRKIEGLTFREREKTVHNPNRPFINNLDDNRFP